MQLVYKYSVDEKQVMQWRLKKEELKEMPKKREGWMVEAEKRRCLMWR